MNPDVRRLGGQRFRAALCGSDCQLLEKSGETGAPPDLRTTDALALVRFQVVTP